MDQFLETWNLPKLKQDEIENVNRLFASKETDSVIKKHLTDNRPGLEDFTGKFYQTSKEKLMLILVKLLQKTEQEGKDPNSFYETSITLFQNQV